MEKNSRLNASETEAKPSRGRISPNGTFRVYIAESRLYRSLTMKEKNYPVRIRLASTVLMGNARVEPSPLKEKPSMWKSAPLAILSSPASSVSSIRLAALTASARSTPISTSNAPISPAQPLRLPGGPAPLREAFEFHPFFSSFPEVRKSTSREPRRGHTFRE